jgi:hypothetical protein
MSKKIETTEISEELVDLGRRSALSRLGLAASAAYAAPLLMTLSQSAHASSGGGSGGGNSGGGNSSGTSGATSGTSGATSGTSGATSGTSGTSDGDDDEYPTT